MDDDDRDSNGFSDNDQDEVMEDVDEPENEPEPEEEEEEEQEEEEGVDAEMEAEADAANEPGGSAADGRSSAAADGTAVDSPATMATAAAAAAASAAAGNGAGPRAASATPQLSTPRMRLRVSPDALAAKVYDIVPTMAAPQATSINALSVTPDLRYWITGGADGYIRKYDGPGTINGKQLLTVAQRHPFVDSVVKAGILMSYWENEEPPTAPTRGAEEHILSPVYSLAVHSRALWLLAGTEGGGINLQSVRHDEGKRITCLQRHTNAVSVLQLAPDEKSVLSGSWDKHIFDWDLNNGQIRRQFDGSGGQISAIELRPASAAPIPAQDVDDELTRDGDHGTFTSSNGRPLPNGVGGHGGGGGGGSGGGGLGGAGNNNSGGGGDASTSGASATINGDDPIPDHESLFGSPGGSLFGGSDAMGANPFGDDDMGAGVDMAGGSGGMGDEVGGFASQDGDMDVDGGATTADMFAPTTPTGATATGTEATGPTTEGDTSAVGTSAAAAAAAPESAMVTGDVLAGDIQPIATDGPSPFVATAEAQSLDNKEGVSATENTSISDSQQQQQQQEEQKQPDPGSEPAPSTQIQHPDGVEPQASLPTTTTAAAAATTDTAETSKDAAAPLPQTGGDESQDAPQQSAALVYSSQAEPAQFDPTQVSETTFFSASIDGTIRIWDRRQSLPVARIGNRPGVPPWCMSACWSPDGNRIYAGRRNGIVEEFDIHKARAGWQAERALRFPAGSGPVSAVRAMVNGRHLVCASHDILRLYDLQHASAFRHSNVPFLIIPGPPRPGVISHLYIDQSSRFLISTAGTRGWEGTNTETLIGYEITSIVK
ncbi:transcription factor [Niveomyces insectorum RCEF 264]|uniref:Transcription factor n=1 Tax=Niveomyces insectorum RCEF 264 TaxID=1081102 RepID=A0A167UTQ2_9HYPO|nr:transcription factor [Niveomyces insectorum RCEF 264]